MIVFLIRRMSASVATLAAASVVIFAALEVLPGNAAQLVLGPTATPEAVATLSRQLGLDRGIFLRYADWIANAFHGDFGNSFAYGTPVAPLIAERLAVSGPLALIAILAAFTIALAAGAFAATRRGKPGDLIVSIASQIGLSIPNFWVGILLVLVFAVWLRWAPSGGFPGWSGGFLPALGALLMPAVALALAQAAILTRVTRSAMIDVLDEDFVRTARAKGLSRAAVVWRHALPNSMVAVLTVAGLQFANLVAGAVVVENVFSLPGLGRLVFQAVGNRDVYVVEDCVMALVALVIAVNFLVEVACAAIDPRLRLPPR